MDQATHENTYNYAGRAIATKANIISNGYTFRQALAEAIKDYRRLVPNSNQSVRELLIIGEALILVLWQNDKVTHAMCN